ncbi:hypothetical protein AMECASPLE_009206 [Ameca splendens]|uniref:Uncharacterized protein n=1 Tax=Ameca splendens TaxID=208324 RepID=A0ABV0XP34_9TELE
MTERYKRLKLASSVGWWAIHKRSSAIRVELGAESLLLKIYTGCPLDASLGRCSWHVPPGGGPGDGPGHARESMSLGWSGNALGSPRRSWRRCLGEVSLGV